MSRARLGADQTLPCPFFFTLTTSHVACRALVGVTCVYNHFLQATWKAGLSGKNVTPGYLGRKDGSGKRGIMRAECHNFATRRAHPVRDSQHVPFAAGKWWECLQCCGHWWERLQLPECWQCVPLLGSRWTSSPKEQRNSWVWRAKEGCLEDHCGT